MARSSPTRRRARSGRAPRTVEPRTVERCVLLTGFEPFGGHGDNPSAEIARRLDGRRIAGRIVRARILPVDLGGLDDALGTALEGLAPVAVVALGLAAGEPVIRLERVALNIADFRLPDNAGATARNLPLDGTGPAARMSRLPLPQIIERLLAAGIPARYSETAGLYLCNAAMYRLLQLVPEPVACGFVHLPLLPAQVARDLAERDGRASERDPTLASMGLDLQCRAVEIVIEAALAAAPAGARRKA